MKILAVSDEVVNILYSPNIVSRFGDVSMVLACGDLPYSYMEFIASMLNVPCLYVHGNHDCDEHTECGIVLKNPGGWVNVDGRTARVRDMIVGGLQGSMRYRPNAPYQYTESEMKLRSWLMTPRLMANRMMRGRYMDILITHAPPLDIHDGKDAAHRGFKAFVDIMERFKPRYLLHGHQHTYYGLDDRQTQYLDTEVINVHPYHLLEW